MRTLKILVRRYLAAILYYSSLLFLYRFFILGRKVAILSYHRITWPHTNDPPCQSGMYVTPSIFHMQMQYLSRHYHVIPLNELIEILKSRRKLPRNTCVITFDDGWRDTLTEALPVLKSFHLPATVFLVTNYIGTKEWFWHEKVNWLLRKLRHPPRQEIIERYPLLKLWSDKRLSHEERIDAIIDHMKSLSPDKIFDVISNLAHLAHQPEFLKDRLVLTWQEVHTLIRHDFTVGSHSHNHLILPNLSQEEILQELRRSMAEIKQHIETLLLCFSYPNGDYDEQIKAQVKKVGYISALSTRFGLVKAADDLFCLRRIPIHNDVTDTLPLFASRLSGVL